MKLHSGSKREGRLTCDGPEDICCGVDGEGILEVGDLRYSCVECDFDICPTCVDAETKEPLTPEQESRAIRARTLSLAPALPRPWPRACPMAPDHRPLARAQAVEGEPDPEHSPSCVT